MTPAKLFAVAAVGLSATACSYSTTTTEARVPAATVTTYPAPATTVYTPAPAATTTVYTTVPVSTTKFVPAATTPPAGVQAFRDEYGFRYDGQGNRIDAKGNIISPQSTRP
jgi:hypothetical protein